MAGSEFHDGDAILDTELERAKKRIKELEVELEKSRVQAEQFLRLLMDAQESLIVAQDGRLVFMNGAFAEMVTVAPEQVTTSSFIEFTHPDDRAKLMQSYSSLLSTGRGWDDVEFRTVTSSGAIRWYRIKGTTGEWNEKPAVLCSINEITSVKDTETKLHHLLEHVPVGIAEIDSIEGRFIRVNQQLCEILGCDREVLMSMNPLDFFPSVTQGLSPSVQQPEHQPPVLSGVAENRIRTVDGRDVWLLINAKQLQLSEDAMKVLAVVQDVTEQKQRETEQRRVEKLESLGVLAGGIAHDFNNLLTAILGNASIGRVLSKGMGRQQEVFTKIEQACYRAQTLTQQLLTFSKGGVPIRKATHLGSILEECESLAMRGSKSRSDLRIANDLWNVRADEGQICQVITNLIINASQAMPDGGDVLVTAANIEIEADSDLPLDPGPYVRIAITDTGHGIAPEHLANVFDPYFTTKKNGTGLGLATAYSIIKKHKGHITVDSTPHESTTFAFFLPATSERLGSSSRESAPPHVDGGRILLLDDEEAMQQLGVTMLEMLGCQATAVGDGATAVSLFESALREGTPFDVVILDLTVKGSLGGKEVVGRMRDVDPDIKAIVMSGYSNDPVLADPHSYGFEEAVAKPFTLELLGESIQRLLGDKRAEVTRAAIASSGR